MGSSYLGATGPSGSGQSAVSASDVHSPLEPAMSCRYAALSGARRVGGQEVAEMTHHRCPDCGSTDTPKLIVRGSGVQESGLFLRCRTCGSEWADTRADLRVS